MILDQAVEVLRKRCHSGISDCVAEHAGLSTTTSVGRSVGTDDHDQRHWLRLKVTDDWIGVMLLFPSQEILAVPVSLSYAHLQAWRCPQAMFSESTALGSISRREVEDPSGWKPVKCHLCDKAFGQLVFASWRSHKCTALVCSQAKPSGSYRFVCPGISSIDAVAEVPANIVVHGRNSRPS